MCIGSPKVPDPPAIPERQAPQQPKTDISTTLSDRDRRRRGYAATMVAGNLGAPATSNVTGV
jgi:hypothetical protein